MNRAALRLSATLLLAGQVLYVVITLFHTGGEANDHPAIFAAYAASGAWTAVHAAQFACIAVMVGGLIALFVAVDAEAAAARWAARFGAVSAVAALAVYAVVLAVDGVALKQAVNAWASAPASEKAARFAAAETVRWLEWGTRSYANYTLGIAVLLFAAAVAASSSIPRLVSFVMVLAGLTYLAEGWFAGTEGFSHAQTVAIVSSEVLNAVWMTWLLVVAWRSGHTRGERAVSA